MTFGYPWQRSDLCESLAVCSTNARAKGDGGLPPIHDIGQRALGVRNPPGPTRQQNSETAKWATLNGQYLLAETYAAERNDNGNRWIGIPEHFSQHASNQENMIVSVPSAHEHVRKWFGNSSDVQTSYDYVLWGGWGRWFESRSLEARMNDCKDDDERRGEGHATDHNRSLAAQSSCNHYDSGETLLMFEIHVRVPSTTMMGALLASRFCLVCRCDAENNEHEYEALDGDEHH